VRSGWRRPELATLTLALASVFSLNCSRAAAPLPLPQSSSVTITEWPAYGGDVGGQRFVDVDAITRANVGELAPAWTYRHGEVSDGKGDIPSTTSFQNTPILVDGTLYVCTPFNRVIALDPATGEERWAYDPKVDLSGHYANQLICRGVATWKDVDAALDSPCRQAVFTGTNDARLIKLDANTGVTCAPFGEGGQVDLNPDAGEQRWKGEYQVTSPPAVLGDIVIVGSAVSDNARTDAPSGVVRGFDARTGALRWAFDLAPPEFDYENGLTSSAGYALGTPNVWAPMSVDVPRGLVFVPTGNAAPDYYHGADLYEMNYYGSSVVALRADTGDVVWHFQFVHGDLWDFDTPAQPVLTTITVDGAPRDALVQATKMGLLFVLDRETGAPLLDVEERAVPTAGAAPGEIVSPTQPFPKTPILVRDSISPDDAWGLTPWDRGKCRDEIAAYRFDGMYTPPSLQGSIMYPGNAGGSNWGGISVDPQRQIALVRSSDIAWTVKLIPRADFESEREAHRGHEHGPQIGTPYGMRRKLLMSPLGLPCVAPPWGTLSAVDLRTGAIRWQVPLGTARDIAPIPWPAWLPLPIDDGVPGTGGAISTSAGVTFIGAAMDDYLRAFDSETGEELWKGRLPAGGQATPMTYRVVFEDGSARQYVVIAAGGHARAGTKLGDYVVAFALEE
jgi:quinoprotein glucose dehydrogenase